MVICTFQVQTPERYDYSNEKNRSFYSLSAGCYLSEKDGFGRDKVLG